MENQLVARLVQYTTHTLSAQKQGSLQRFSMAVFSATFSMPRTHAAFNHTVYFSTSPTVGPQQQDTMDYYAT